MRRLRLFLDFDKEQRWLDGLLREGWLLTDARYGVYTFAPIAPVADTVIRVDFLMVTDNRSFLDYCTLFADSGWQHLAGTRYSGTQYFLRTRTDASTDIFSDEASSATRYRRLARWWLTVPICYVPHHGCPLGDRQVPPSAFVRSHMGAGPAHRTVRASHRRVRRLRRRRVDSVPAPGIALRDEFVPDVSFDGLNRRQLERRRRASGGSGGRRPSGSRAGC